MDGNKLKNLLQEIRAVLEPDLQKSGAVFYSGRRTLEKGNFYLMGLNPGGDPNKEGKICSSLDEWEKSEHDWSAYVNDNWTKTPGKEGKAQHQEKCPIFVRRSVEC